MLNHLASLYSYLLSPTGPPERWATGLQRITNNDSLWRAGIISGLSTCIFSEPHAPKQWVLPGQRFTRLVGSVASEDDLERDITSISYTKRAIRILHRKVSHSLYDIQVGMESNACHCMQTIADAVEAAIALEYLWGGLDAAIIFCGRIGLAFTFAKQLLHVLSMRPTLHVDEQPDFSNALPIQIIENAVESILLRPELLLLAFVSKFPRGGRNAFLTRPSK